MCHFVKALTPKPFQRYLTTRKPGRLGVDLDLISVGGLGGGGGGLGGLGASSGSNIMPRPFSRA